MLATPPKPFSFLDAPACRQEHFDHTMQAIENDLFKTIQKFTQQYNFDFEMEEPIETENKQFAWEPCLLLHELRDTQNHQPIVSINAK